MGRLRVALALALLCAGLGLAVPATASGQPVDTVVEAQQFDHATFYIGVYGNGSARWTFRYTRILDNRSEREEFRSFAADFENRSLPLYEDFRQTARSLAADGENRTGRSMSAGGFARRAYVRGLNDNLGVVEMSFTWHGFARADGDSFVLGDVFEGGLYIGPGQRLVVEALGPVAFEDASPAPDQRSGASLSTSDTLTWVGERQFSDNRPRVVLVRGATTTATTATTSTVRTTNATEPGGPGGTDGGPDGSSSVLSTVPWLLVTAFATVLVVGAVVLLQRAGLAFDDSGDDGSGVAGGDGPGPPVGPAVPDEEMLTDEERVLGLLRENGGRMRQVNIVEDTGWSKSKVSMLLSEMEDADQVRKLRVGRENIVSLPGHEPDASDSSLE